MRMSHSHYHRVLATLIAFASFLSVCHTVIAADNASGDGSIVVSGELKEWQWPVASTGPERIWQLPQAPPAASPV